MKPPHWIKANGGRSLIFSSNVLNQETVGDYARALREFKPTLLCAYPTSLECLCRLLRDHGERVEIARAPSQSVVPGPGDGGPGDEDRDGYGDQDADGYFVASSHA